MNEQIRDLIALITDHSERLDSIKTSIDASLVDEIERLGKTDNSALIIAGLLENSALFELLKFRHFKRYYFDLEYDWDRLDFLVIMLSKAHPIARRDLSRFVSFLEAV